MGGNLNEAQFGQYTLRHYPPEMGREHHLIRAVYQHPDLPGREVHVGELRWNAKHVLNVLVPDQFQRRGIASAMWQHGQDIAGGRIPRPKHSAQRTSAGDAWARSIGGKLPRRQT